MHPSDQEFTTFTTDKGLYCYNVIPFGLKNPGSTYQQLMNAMFAEQLGKIIEVYVDDMLVKSIKASRHVVNLRIIFAILFTYGMRFNPEKCFFGVTATSKSLKEYLAAVPLLSIPVQGEILYIYLAVSLSARHEWGGDKIHPLEQLALALIVASKCLRQYFQSHTIHVLTNQQLKQAMQNPEHSERLSKWAIELSEFDIEYKPQIAMNGQAVADFIAELTEPQGAPTLGPAEGNTTITTTEQPAPKQQSDWSLHVGGSASTKPCATGVIVTGPGGVNVEYALKFNFTASNNMAEYEAHIAGLLLAIDLGANSVNIFSDSQLVINQVNDINPSWIDEIIKYKLNGMMPTDKVRALQLKRRATHYNIKNGKLYCQGFTHPNLRCLIPAEGKAVLAMIHAGEYENHSGARSLANRTMPQGYL
ncbi:uncharacterized protein LOC112173002 [Rosa chinensis]|uniref:uncharacterized protein LOC112173002 n=1 Tax=Rosa chinensis TaxID=74649 RepID=UPI000D08FE1D|nr:uncharacterized protein LOC112173002 [Rosa chinensis]